MSERKLFNSTINVALKGMERTHIIRTPGETELVPAEDALSDDLHLNTTHAQLMANAICQRLEWHLKDTTRNTRMESTPQEPREPQPSTSQRPRPSYRETYREPYREHTTHREEMYRTVVEANEEDIKEIIGGQHNRIRDTEIRHGVQVQATRDNPGKIFISGKTENVRAAEREIVEKRRELEDRRRRNNTRREERSNTVCRYYAQGRCTRGNKCFFKHESHQTEQRTSHRSRSRERQPPSSRPRISAMHE
jgi:hypothetical protein